MIFVNSLTELTPEESFDDSACTQLTIDVSDLGFKLSAEMNAKVGEFYYALVDNYLFALTDYSWDGSKTSFSGDNAVYGLLQTKLPIGSYTLGQIFSSLGYKYELISTDERYDNNDFSTSVIFNDTNTIANMLSTFEKYTSSIILPVMKFDPSIKENQQLFPFSITVYITQVEKVYNTYDVDQISVLKDDIGNTTSLNPALDIAHNLTFSIQNVDAIAELKSWKPLLTSSEYTQINNYILQATNSITADQAEAILINALTFSINKFSKAKGTPYIVNSSNQDLNNIPYDLGTLDFAPLTQFKNALSDLLLSKYQNVNASDKNWHMMSKPPVIRMVDIAENMFYASTDYQIDLKAHKLKNISLRALGEFNELY